uniref:ribonuclease H n=1 Tax=Takifugu rubripes TaxID=31033 RepID=A0A674P8V3_TAKRU
MPILTQRPQTEPTVNVTVYSRQHQFMIDTGATYSCIGKDGANLPLSPSKIRTIGFSGKKQVIPMTEPVPLQIGKIIIYASLLYSADAPNNLLGRDVLCQLQAKIKCTPEGIYFDVADEQPNRISVPMMSLTTPQVPPQVWSQHKTDVGFVKSAELQKFRTKPGVRLPYQRQYPLRPDTIEGIRSTIDGLENAGVLIKTRSVCNIPIFPIRKPNGDEYRLVHDLRAINAIVTEEIPIVPDPHTLLSNIPPGTKWFTVIDLCSAFFSVPVHPDSQYLFAFTYKNQQYTYTHLPQGFVHSPSIFNRILASDLNHLDIQSTTLMYVDDILICSKSKEQCEKDSIIVLTALAGGHKVSKKKLQFCQQTGEKLCHPGGARSRVAAPPR